MNGAVASALELLFPPKCILCGTLLGSGGTDLCPRCRVEVPAFRGAQKDIPFVADFVGVWYYEGAVRESLRRCKFSGRRSYCAGYGRLLAMTVAQAQLTFDVLTYVPVSRSRRFVRGFDQSQLLAQAVGQELGVPCVALLKKIRNNPPQSGISGAAERRANVLGVFAAQQPEVLRGRRILLLDDIITTGATVSECARVLLTAGAAEVICAAVAVADSERKQS